MTAENEHIPTARHPITLSPWLVLVAALALYGVTLNHWVTLGSLQVASQLSGWDWHPLTLHWRPSSNPPLLFVLTYPLRLLPVVWRPLALNIFTAVCAALTLALLARSVRLLPHDRTREQRQREGGEFALLSVRGAFVPALFAVLLMAFEMTFWENSIAGTGEMINELVFAFLILSLLEFRISQSQWRLDFFALVYGLGVANDWALIAFFPCFLVSLVWIKGRSFFNWRFLLRTAGCGAAGLLLYLLMPLIGALAGDGGFWALLRDELGAQHFYIRIAMATRYMAPVVLVPTMIPLLFAGIKWPSFEGELSPGAHDLSRGLFRFLHVICLAIGVLMFFDVKYSPSPREKHFAGYLTFYYLAALSVGYFSGYLLLVFGRDPANIWMRSSPALKVLNWSVVGLLCAAAFGMPVWLFALNLPKIRAGNDDVVAQYGEALVETLPAKPALVLVDDPVRLRLVAGAACQRQGKSNRYVFLDTSSFPHREYFRYLRDHYPVLHQTLVDPASLPEVVDAPHMADLIEHLARHEVVYYLQPSFGYYFERVYLVPHGMGGDVNAYPTNTLVVETPLPKTNEMAQNIAYWRRMEKGPLSSLPRQEQLSVDAQFIAGQYSQMVDCWGVTLQRAATERRDAALLKEAGDQFAVSAQLNPDNVVAKINKQYNARLRGAPPDGPLIDPAELANMVANWDALVVMFGPVDEPFLDFQFGRVRAQYRDYLQAIHLFERCLQFPGHQNDSAVQLDLAKSFVDLGYPDMALGTLARLGAPTTADRAEIVRIKALALTKKADFKDAEKLLDDALDASPKDLDILGVMIEFYRFMGYANWRESNGDPKREATAAVWFIKALAAIDTQVRLLNLPEHASYTAELPNALLKKAEMQRMLRDWPAAIATLDQAAQIIPGDPEVLLNRGIAEMQLKKFDQARADFLGVKTKTSTPAQLAYAYFGLAGIAQQQKDDSAEARYCKLYLENAPAGTSDFTNITRRLQKLEGR